MIIRIDDSVFTVDESEAYTVLRLIKKVLIPKQESLDENVGAIDAKANEALNKATANGEAIEVIEDELEGLNETTIPNMQDEINSLGTSLSLVGGQVTEMQEDVDRVISEDIPRINNDIIALRQGIASDVNQRIESWNVVKLSNGSGETVVDSIDVTVSELNNVVFFSSIYIGYFNWGSESDVMNQFAIKIPNTSVSGLMVNGCIGGTNQVKYRFARLEENSNRYIVVANQDEVVSGWYGSGIVTIKILSGTSYHFSGFYIKGD